MRHPRSSRRRVSLAVALCLVLGVADGRAVGAAEAINPDNRPTPISGHENGRLPATELIGVVPGCAVARAAGPSLHRLFALARASRVALGARDCYRPIDEQVSVGQQWTSRGNSACAAQPRFDPSGRPIGTSMHGWGKALDASDNGAGMTFSSAGYRFLKGEAGRLGWNHPGWAEPYGSACPEPWHWEWVGDGGTQGAPPVRADVVALLPSEGGRGYASVSGLGVVTARGDAVHRGDAGGLRPNWVIVGAAATPTRRGYWLTGADGGVFTFGDAGFFGSTGAMRLNAPIVGMAATPSGDGYWLVAADGGVFTFGDAGFFGSTGGTRLNSPVVAMTPTPSGAGYWLVAADGGVFTFGDAGFFGSAGSLRLAAPVMGAAAAPSGDGYWLVAHDGGIFTYGSAAFHGSAGGLPLVAPVVSITPTSNGDGYWLAAADGGVFTYGAAGFHGSA